MAVTATHAFVHGVADGPDATIVQPSDWNANHTFAERTKRIPLVPRCTDGGAALTHAVDAHGSLDTVTPHLDYADDANAAFICYPVSVPIDDNANAASDWKLKVLFSNAAGGGNIRVQPVIKAYAGAGGATASTQLLNTTTTMAAHANANTQAVGSFNFSTQPTAGQQLTVYFGLPRNDSDVADTNTGQVSIYDIWLEYQRDH